MTGPIAATFFGHIAEDTASPGAVGQYPSWGAFAGACFGRHDVRSWKDGPLFTGATFRPGGREKEHVQAVSVAVLDFDHVYLDALERVQARLDAGQFAHAIYTSFRHQLPEGTLSFRLVLPITRPLQASEYEGFYLKLIDAFGGDADTSCTNANRLWYLPSCPPERAEHAFTSWCEGNVLDVAAILARPGGAAPARPGFGGLVSKEMLDAWGATMRRKAEPLAKAVGWAMKNVMAGEPFAPDGQRDNAIFAIACALADSFPDADPSALGMFFGPSLHVMETAGENPTIEIVAEKIARKQREVRQARTAPADERTRRIIGLYRTGRDYGYTPEELQAWGDLSHRWILTRGEDLYFFVNGEYVYVPKGPYVANAMLDYLAPAVGINLTRPTKEGHAMVPITELAMVHGTALDGVEASLLSQRTVYDPNKRVLVEATAPRAEVGPATHDAWIEHWMTALLGQAGLDWLAVLTKLGEASPALFLSGAPGVGKSLLANGLAKLWKEGRPTSLSDVLGTDFNDALSRCPLVFGDEKIPTDRGRPKIEELKRLITDTRHALKVKFRNTRPLEGAARVILAANDPSVVFGRSALTQEDIAAAMDRFVYVEPLPEARRILADLPKATLHAWVEGGGIARHALWLAENRTVDGTGRLACPASLGTMKDRLTIATGLRWEILDWIVSYLENPALVNPEFLKMKRLARPVHVAQWGETVWVKADSIFMNWDKYADAKKAPDKRRVQEEISNMSTGRSRFFGTNYRRIDLDTLSIWCKVADRELPDLKKVGSWLQTTFGANEEK